MHVVVLGPTGVVGDSLARAALAEPRIARVTAVSRRPLRHSAARLTTVLHQDFRDFAPLEPLLASADFIFCALGISWYQVHGEAEYRAITHDYVMACARAAAVANPAMRLCFVSGHGASLQSSQAWARIKAETERDLRATFGTRLTIFRPGYVFPAHGRERPYWGDAIMRPLMPLRRVMSRWITDSDEVARAVLFAAFGGRIPSPATNRDIIAAAAAYQAASAAGV